MCASSTSARASLRQHLWRRVARGQRAADAEQRVRLAFARLRVARPRALQRRELAHDDAHEEQQDDAEVLRRIEIVNV